MTDLSRLRRKFKNYEDLLDKAIMQGLTAAAMDIESTAKQSITEGGKGGRIYRKRSVTHRASAPGEAPASDTGRLVQSITIRSDKNTQKVEIVAGGGIANVKYAKALEFGTSKMLPRPFMHPAYMENKDVASNYIERAAKVISKKIAISKR